MIFDVFFWLLIAPLEGAIGLLPDAGTLGLATNGVIVGMATFNTFLPLAETATVLVVVLGAQAAMVAFATVRTIWHMLPLKFS